MRSVMGIALPALLAGLLTGLGAATPSVAAELANPYPGVGDGYGTSVSWLGPNVVVGAAGDDIGALYPDTGTAFLLDGNPASPTFGALLKLFISPVPSSAASFGSAIVSFGDYLIIGSPFAGTGSGRPGAAYMYDPDLSGPAFLGTHVHTFDNPRPGPGSDQFGYSLAKVGNNVVIGAFVDSTLAPGAGAAYVFDADSTSPTFGDLLHTIENPDPGFLDHFGVASSAAGDGKVLIGAFRDDGGGNEDSGAAYLFDLDPDSDTFGQVLQAFFNPEPSSMSVNGQNDEFGHTIASTDRIALISAFRDDAGAMDTGVVYLFDVDPGSPSFGALLSTINNPTLQAFENFGESLAVDGDRAYVGAWWSHDQVLFGGVVYVYDISDPTSPRLLPGETLLNPAPEVLGLFGTSVAADNGKVLVGAPGVGLGGTAHFVDDN